MCYKDCSVDDSRGSPSWAMVPTETRSTPWSAACAMKACTRTISTGSALSQTLACRLVSAHGKRLQCQRCCAFQVRNELPRMRRRVLLCIVLTSNSCGRGCPGRGSRGPTILKLGVMGRTHSMAQCAGAIVSTSRLRSAGASGWKECSSLANKEAC